MRCRGWIALPWLLAAWPAAALEPGDLVVGVGAALFVVDPGSGAAELLSEGSNLGSVTSIAARADGTVFFALTDPLHGVEAVWRLEAGSGAREVVAPAVPSPGISIGGVALDPRGRLVVAYADADVAPGAQPEIQWLDPESGARLAAVPLPGNVVGISCVAADGQGRALVSSARSGVLRVDPESGALEWVGARPAPGLPGGSIALEADGSILITSLCLFVARAVEVVRPVDCRSLLQRIDPETAVAPLRATRCCAWIRETASSSCWRRFPPSAMPAPSRSCRRGRAAPAGGRPLPSPAPRPGPETARLRVADPG